MTLDFPFEESCEPYKINLVPGKYRFEAWGASGGGDSTCSGKGGYTSGNIVLKNSTNIYIFVGGKGKDGRKIMENAAGGCNGGGKGGQPYSVSYSGGSGGGGATDIRLSYSINDRILVSGGGGGNAGYSYVSGGYGGGIIAGNSSYVNVSIGASQTFGTINGTGEDGRNALYLSSSGAEGNGGAGGGYRGGTTSKISGLNSNVGGSGGSSYISGYSECVQYLNYTFTGIDIKNGKTNFKSPAGKIETGHNGDGFARITLLSVVKCTRNCRSRSHTLISFALILINK